MFDSMRLILRYHLGTAAFGSFIIAVIKFILLSAYCGAGVSKLCYRMKQPKLVTAVNTAANLNATIARSAAPAPDSVPGGDADRAAKDMKHPS